jgi:osmotically inducible lipoprotein OsmB
MRSFFLAGSLAMLLAACNTTDQRIAGAAAGALVGGPIGAIAGGAIGAVAAPSVTGSINKMQE